MIQNVIKTGSLRGDFPVTDTAIARQVETAFVSWAVPDFCLCNVERQVAEQGGRAVYGWRVMEGQQPITFHIWHVVWERPDGELRDITPEDQDGLPPFVTFIPDPTALPLGVLPNRQPPPSRFYPRKTSPHVSKACEYLARSETSDLSGNSEAAQYWRQKAHTELAKAGY